MANRDKVRRFSRIPLRVITAVALILFLSVIAQAQQQTPPTLIMISIDGMKPEYVTHADQHGAKVPNLRRMMKEGTYAEGVLGVIPTVTYASHTALVTGVWPAKHE